MSLLPWAFGDPFVEPYRPRFWDASPWSPWERELRQLSRWGGLRSFDPSSRVQFDKDKFQVNVDVQQFAPNEITVKTSGDNSIIVEGKHEEKPDEHGFISRHFVRRYVLPEGHDINQVVSNLSSDGVLTITAPKTEKGVEHKTIPIQHTGRPSKAVEEKK